MEQNIQKQAPIISEAIWVVILSAATYSVAFSFESGYAQYFHIPFSIIAMSPTLLAHAAGVMLCAMFPIYMITSFIWGLIPRSDNAIARMFRRLWIGALGFFVIFSPMLFNGEGWLLYCGIIGTISIIEVVVPFVVQRKVKTFANKLEAQEMIDGSSHCITKSLVDKFGRGVILFFLVLIATITFSNTLGFQEAKQKREFLLVKGDPNVAVLASYDSLFVTQSFDPQSKQLVGHFKIMKIGDGKEIELTPTNVGPLKANKLQTLIP